LQSDPVGKKETAAQQMLCSGEKIMLFCAVQSGAAAPVCRLVKGELKGRINDPPFYEY